MGSRELRDDGAILTQTYLMVPPELGKSIRIDNPKDLGFLIFPFDVWFVPAVRQQLIDIVPE